jgi:hypothetical protein
VLLALALLVLVGLVLASLASLTRRPFLVAGVLVLGVVGLTLQAAAGDGQLTAAIVLLLLLAGLALKAVADLAGALRPDRRPVQRTRAEREAAARERRRRLAA